MEMRPKASRARGSWLVVKKTVPKKNKNFRHVIKSKPRQLQHQRTLEPSRYLAPIVRSSNDAIFSLTTTGKITSWNKAAEMIYGYSAGEAIGHSISITIPPDRKQEFEQFLKKVKRGKIIKQFETFRVHKNRTPIYLSLTISPIKDATGKIIGASAIAHDITERKRAEEALHDSEERLRTIINSSPEAIVVTDADMNVVSCNQAALKIAGLSSKDELIGKYAFDFIIPSERHRAVYDLKKKAGLGVAKGLEYKLLTNDGRELFVEISASVIPDKSGKPASFVFICRDITERKRAEEELLRREKIIRIGETTLGDINRKYGVKTTASELGLEDILEHFAELNTRPAPQIIFAMLVMATSTVFQQTGVKTSEGEVREFFAPIIKRTLREFFSLAREFGRDIPREYVDFEKALKSGSNLKKLSMIRDNT
ncbi:MAG: PAS domain-containing protein [Methanobacteriota archaeon]